MQRHRGPFLQDGTVPVFAIPASLTFIANEQSTHKQVLTLYNPYDFSIKYKVLSTVPKNYDVVNPSGVVKPRHVIDIVIRHKAVDISNIGIVDKFRISIYEEGQRVVLGKKDIPSTLISSRAESDDISANEAEVFSRLPLPRTSQQPQYDLFGSYQASPPYSVIVVCALVCITVLMLPTEGLDSSELPVYLHLPLIYKLVASFVLGIVTVLLLRV